MISSRLRSVDPLWDECLRPHFPEVVEVLRPSKIADQLYGQRLIDQEELLFLSEDNPSEKEKARHLLVKILPKKGPGTFEKFVNILKTVEGYGYIVQLFHVNEHQALAATSDTIS